jgi:predicted  nucleic acid-binding Zn-ribbon protein
MSCPTCQNFRMNLAAKDEEIATLQEEIERLEQKAKKARQRKEKKEQKVQATEDDKDVEIKKLRERCDNLKEDCNHYAKMYKDERKEKEFFQAGVQRQNKAIIRYTAVVIGLIVVIGLLSSHMFLGK